MTFKRRKKFCTTCQITIFLNVTGIDYWVVLVHNRNLVYPTFGNIFGQTFLMVRPHENADSDNAKMEMHAFEISRDRWKFVTTKKAPCNEDEVKCAVAAKVAS